MATIRKRGEVWQAQVRRAGYAPQSASFKLRADALAWSREREAALDRGLGQPQSCAGGKVTLAAILQRYGVEVASLIRQHAIAAWNVAQKAKQIAMTGGVSDDELKANTALIEGVRRFVLEVRDLNVDLIDRIDPFEAAYAVIGKSMTENTLKQVQAIISAKKVKISEEEARDLAKRAVRFKQERGRAPDINSQDPWEKRMAEGVAALARYVAQAKNG